MPDDRVSDLDVCLQEIRGLKKLMEKIDSQLRKPEVKSKDQLWTVGEVAEYLHKSKGTIQSHYQGRTDFPRSKKIGNARYWRPEEIIAWARGRRIH
ncbi:MAG: DNA-binding protein [Bacteroidetes bacterium]|nr:MAG: DNA-binding protein [Bacteroidota bacterium]